MKSKLALKHKLTLSSNIRDSQFSRIFLLINAIRRTGGNEVKYLDEGGYIMGIKSEIISMRQFNERNVVPPSAERI